MKIRTESKGRYLVVTILEERLGADRALSFKESMSKLMDQGHSAFVFDLTAVSFIDSSGLGAILATAKRLGRSGEILVAGASESVSTMFKLTRMDRIFPLFPTVEEAFSARV